jgi:multiple sugar transport system permease protein
MTAPLTAAGKVGKYVAALFLAAIFSFPLLFMIMSSFKGKYQIFEDLRSWRAFLPVGEISLDQYRGVFERTPVATFFTNSIVISVVVVLLGLFINSLAAYAIARLKFRGQGVLLGFLIATLIVPFETIALPLLFLVNKLPYAYFENGSLVFTQGWLNSYAVQIVPFLASGFSIFLFVQYFKTIPRELDEAAIIDGASFFGIYRKVIVPLSGPAFATSAILTFLAVWNSYLWPVMSVQKESMRPVQVGLDYFFASGTDEGLAWGQIMAYSTLVTVPILLVFIVFQRAFVSSVASSGVKG